MAGIETAGAGKPYDFCVIGGGIVGLATARALLARHPGARLVLVEKEDGFARHQTGHNSGVIHAGIYYAPGSLKAQLCREGAEATKAFCTANGIPFETCGKLIVATNDLEMERMAALETRAGQNGIAITRLDQAGLKAAEPAITGLGALKVHATGIVSYAAICRRMAEEIREAGGEILTRAAVTAIAEDENGVWVTAGSTRLRALRLAVCGGVQADRLAKMAGFEPDFQIVPFRGEYFLLPPDKNRIVSHLIYPVPDPDLPFLGIHLTRMIDGTVTVGPNAVLGFAREGYPRFSMNLRDIADMARFPGLWRLVRKNLSSAYEEGRDSVFKSGYLEKCRKYCPELKLSDLGPYPAGIRAQAVMKDGSLVHDFLFMDSPRMLHVCNAPSPAATSAMPIAGMIVDRMLGAA